MEVGCGALSSFVKIMRIGHGAFGDVWLAEDIIKNRRVALKKLISKETREGFSKSAIREIILLRKLNHINVVRLHGVVFSKPRLFNIDSSTQDNNSAAVSSSNNQQSDKGSIWMVFEYLPFDLTGYMESLRLEGRTIRVIDIKIITKQLLLSLEYCHSNNIIHRDIKCANLLISADGILKLADFGLGRIYSYCSKLYTNRVITLWYRPPELLLGSKTYDTSVDMWSVGCILGELILQQPLFCSETEKGILKSIGDLFGPPPSDILHEYEQLPLWEDSEYNPLLKKLGFGRGSKYEQFTSRVKSKVGSQGLDLLLALLQYSPKERPTASEALRHPWLNCNSTYVRIPERLDMSILAKRKQFHSLTARRLRDKIQGRVRLPLLPETGGAPDAKVGKAYFVEHIKKLGNPNTKYTHEFADTYSKERTLNTQISTSQNIGCEVRRLGRSGNKERKESPRECKDRHWGRDHTEHRQSGEYNERGHLYCEGERHRKKERLEHDGGKRDYLERDRYNPRSLERELEHEQPHPRYSHRKNHYEGRESKYGGSMNTPISPPPRDGGDYLGSSRQWWRSSPMGGVREHTKRANSMRSGRADSYEYRSRGYDLYDYRR